MCIRESVCICELCICIFPFLQLVEMNGGLLVWKNANRSAAANGSARTWVCNISAAERYQKYNCI